MPTAMPTRWPTPISAIDRLAETVVAPPPNRKALGRLGGDQLGLGERWRKPAETTELERSSREAALVLLGPADPGADLEHFGRGDAFGIGQVRPVTSARRSGTEYITPRMPPMAITATDSQ